MPELDFDRDFQSFVAGQQGSAIKEIYEIIPSLSQEQMQIFNSLIYFCDKWGLGDLQSYLDAYRQMMLKNKNLGALASFNMKNLLKAYTQEELIRGIKVSTNRMEGGDAK
jgi:hypothetical protein